jgi:mitochondrial fission protein ELM1
LTTHSAIWLLLDGRLSHRSQLLGVAEQLGYEWTEKEIRYNSLAGLANRIFGARTWHLNPESRKIINVPWPALVIAAGRRSAPVALAIKKRSPVTKLVHLMWPDVAPEHFDLIAVPDHDTLSYKSTNLIRTFGAPHMVTSATLAAQTPLWEKRIAHMPRPRIALCIGGSTKGMQYEPADFKTLAAYASAEADRLNGSLLVTSSPRTGEAAEKLIKPLLTVPHYFHSYHPDQPNPYLAFLGLADAIIVTGDSISMCSEACATGKPVYIFVPPHLSRDKNSFREVLFSRAVAKSHTYPIRLDWQPTPMPDAAKQVAEAIEALIA